MNRMSMLPLAMAAALATSAAHAVVVSATFTGLVQSQVNAGFVLDSPITGSFAYDTASSEFLSYAIGGQSVAAGFQSTASLTPDLYTALYTAQLSPLQPGITVNSTFSLDLEGFAPWTAASAIGLLGDASQLSANLDLPDSTFRFYTANADGSGVRSAVAQLTGISAVAAVPEPGTFALLALGLGAVGWYGGRRQR